MKLNYLWTFLIPILFISCSSDVTNIADDNNPDDGGTVTVGSNKVLSLVTNETVGNNCPNGGFKIELGIDTNSNGVLDTDEITNTDFVCNGNDGQAGDQGPAGNDGANGVDGKSTLISTEVEAAGTNCESGGIKINIGLDTNGNDVLDANEITVEDYICNGANGASGGITNLVLTGNITNEEARIKIEKKVGPDTQFILIQNTSSLTTIDLSGVTEAIDIEIRNNKELTNISFPNLTTCVDKFFIISNPKLATIGLPVLKDVNEFQISNSVVSDIEIPMLENIFSRLFIDSNPNLNSLELPLVVNGNLSIRRNNNLTILKLPILLEGFVDIFESNLSTVDLPSFVNGRVNISGNSISSIGLLSMVTGEVSIAETNMASFNFPKLREASRIGFFRNPLLTNINLPNLEAVNSIDLSDNNSLVDFELPLVASIGNVELDSSQVFPVDGGIITKGNIRITQNEKLESFSLPMLINMESINVDVEFNNSLQNIDFSNAIGTNTNIRILNNPQVQAIIFSKITSARSIEIIDNELLTSINFSNLVSVFGSDRGFNLGVEIFSNPLITANFSSLKTVGSVNFPNSNFSFNTFSDSFTGLDLSMLEEASRIVIGLSINTSMGGTVDLSSIRSFNRIYMSGIASDSTTAIFGQLVSIVPAISGKEINISNAPTGQGIIDAQTLRDNGNNVAQF